MNIALILGFTDVVVLKSNSNLLIDIINLLIKVLLGANQYHIHYIKQ